MASGRASVVGDGRRVPDEPPSYEDLFGPAKASPDKNVHATPSAPPLEEINLSKEDLSDEAAEPHCDNPPQLDSRPPPANLEALFQYIRSYKPESIKLKRKLKPFILDYIPAVTAPDLMIKVSRPDGRPEQLGFRVLDEPGSQSFDLENMKIDDENGKKKDGGGDMPKPTHAPSGGRGAHQFDEDDDDDDDEDGDDSEESEDDDENGEQIEGAYDPSEYEHLSVHPDVKTLFQYITRYTPQSKELDHKMKPSIPDYIPAVGDTDAFIKVSRPDGKAEQLGIYVLDEPCAKQSDPTVLD